MHLHLFKNAEKLKIGCLQQNDGTTSKRISWNAIAAGNCKSILLSAMGLNQWCSFNLLITITIVVTSSVGQSSIFDEHYMVIPTTCAIMRLWYQSCSIFDYIVWARWVLQLLVLWQTAEDKKHIKKRKIERERASTSIKFKNFNPQNHWSEMDAYIIIMTSVMFPVTI